MAVRARPCGLELDAVHDRRLARARFRLHRHRHTQQRQPVRPPRRIGVVHPVAHGAQVDGIRHDRDLPLCPTCPGITLAQAGSGQLVGVLDVVAEDRCAQEVVGRELGGVHCLGAEPDRPRLSRVHGLARTHGRLELVARVTDPDHERGHAPGDNHEHGEPDDASTTPTGGSPPLLSLPDHRSPFATAPSGNANGSRLRRESAAPRAEPSSTRASVCPCRCRRCAG